MMPTSSPRQSVDVFYISVGFSCIQIDVDAYERVALARVSAHSYTHTLIYSSHCAMVHNRYLTKH